MISDVATGMSYSPFYVFQLAACQRTRDWCACWRWACYFGCHAASHSATCVLELALTSPPCRRWRWPPHSGPDVVDLLNVTDGSSVTRCSL